jgi:uncharacterized protein YdaU (DUF1376 family)
MKFYKRDPDRALSGMMELTLKQRGAYNSIIDLLYSKDGDVPDDDQRVAKMIGCHWREWKAVKGELIALGKVWIEGGKLQAKRVQDTLKEAARFSQDQSKKASSGWEKRKSDNENNDTVMPSGNASTPTATPTPIDRKEDVTTVTSLVPDDVDEAVQIYNVMAKRVGLPFAQKITPERKQKIRARLKDCGGLPGWRVAMDKLADSPLCRGEKSDWKADLDFVLKPAKFVKLMEGSYDGKTTASGPSKSAEKFSRLHAVAAEAARRAAATGGPGGGEDTGGVPVHRQAGGRLPFGDD